MRTTEKKLQYSRERVGKIFHYLDRLRESGVTNMWGSPQYVANAFKIEWDHASIIVGAWMDSFAADGTTATDAIVTAINAKLAA